MTSEGDATKTLLGKEEALDNRQASWGLFPFAFFILLPQRFNEEPVRLNRERSAWKSAAYLLWTWRHAFCRETKMTKEEWRDKRTRLLVFFQFTALRWDSKHKLFFSSLELKFCFLSGCAKLTSPILLYQYWFTINENKKLCQFNLVEDVIVVKKSWQKHYGCLKKNLYTIILLYCIFSDRSVTRKLYKAMS